MSANDSKGAANAARFPDDAVCEVCGRPNQRQGDPWTEETCYRSYLGVTEVCYRRGYEREKARADAAEAGAKYMAELASYFTERAPHCRCGHHWLAHCGHTYANGMAEPHFCSQADGCDDYQPGNATEGRP